MMPKIQDTHPDFTEFQPGAAHLRNPTDDSTLLKARRFEANPPYNNSSEMGYTRIEPDFPLGHTVASSGLVALGLDLFPLLLRHQTGDWGDLSEGDKSCNQQALINGEPIFSTYHVVTLSGSLVIIYVVTDRDLNLTTIFLAEEC